MNQETIIKLLTFLIQSSLLDKPIDEDAFKNLNVQEWKAIFDLAQKQGVLDITFECIKKYKLMKSSNDNPSSLTLLMAWMGYWNFIKQQYKSHCQTAKDMVYNFRRSKCDILILKGLSLSKYYPLPDLRSSGDIDIFSFGDHTRVNSLISDNGIDIAYDDKHDVFSYNGITIEHHKTFIGLISKPARIIENFLQSVSSRDDCLKTEDGWYMPNEKFNAIFLLRHMSKHYFSEGLSLKQIIDWGMFLHKAEINKSDVKDILIKAGMVKAWDTFSSVAGIVLGLDFHFISSSQKTY